MITTTYRPEAQPFQGSIYLQGEELYFKSFVLPARHTPHVSADSPRFMDPGHPPVVIGIPELYRDDYDGICVTNRYWYYMDAIRSLIVGEWKKDQGRGRTLVSQGGAA